MPPPSPPQPLSGGQLLPPSTPLQVLVSFLPPFLAPLQSPHLAAQAPVQRNRRSLELFWQDRPWSNSTGEERDRRNGLYHPQTGVFPYPPRPPPPSRLIAGVLLHEGLHEGLSINAWEGWDLWCPPANQRHVGVLCSALKMMALTMILP